MAEVIPAIGHGTTNHTNQTNEIKVMKNSVTFVIDGLSALLHVGLIRLIRVIRGDEFSLQRRQSDRELGAVAGFTLHADGAVVGLDDFVGGG